MITPLYTCLCCGYKTLEEPAGNFEICPICYWEDDNQQRDNPHYAGGANKEYLYKAQQNFLEFGASGEAYLDIFRKPTSEYIKDTSFQLIKTNNT